MTSSWVIAHTHTVIDDHDPKLSHRISHRHTWKDVSGYEVHKRKDGQSKDRERVRLEGIEGDIKV